MKKNIFLCLLLACCLLFQAASMAAAPVQTEGITIPVMEGMKDYGIPENEALAFVRDMKCGWNLGNTFDAVYNDNRHDTSLNLESYWNGAVTTKELIEALKEAGFNSIRIPVSWHNHVDENDVIDEAWLNRVKEVAGWALDLGMYAIVNIHHDNEPAFFYPDREHAERTDAYMTAIWTQMSEAFRDCDNHLLLESMNEPRLKGTNFEWWWDENDKSCRESMERINELNQKFVDIVRASGGNNATRYLVVPSYCANPGYAVNEAFVLPKDTAENRIIVAAHAYTPYNFALNTGSPDKTFDLENEPEKKREITLFMNDLYDRFVANGIPVIMDEFGAIDKDNTQDRVNFAAFYSAAGSIHGLTCFWWDNGNYKGGGERFSLINRKTLEWYYPDIVLAIMENCMLNRK